MVNVIFARTVWDHSAPPLAISGVKILDMHVGPEPGYPFGRRGLAVAGMWRQLVEPGITGLLTLDGDVAIDPLDVRAMFAAIDSDPGAVHVGPIRLWPTATLRPDWVWAHHDGIHSQTPCDKPSWFTFGFTYLPRALVERCIKAGLPKWEFPWVDRRVSEQYQASGLPVSVVDGCHPKHLHY